MTSTQHNHHLFLSSSNSKIPVPVNRNLHINSFKNDSILSKNTNLLQFDGEPYSRKIDQRTAKQALFQSYSLQTSPSNSIYSKNKVSNGRQHPHSTNCTPQHFCKNSTQNSKYRDFKNDFHYLDHDLSNSSGNNNSSNDELYSNSGSDNSELNNFNDENLSNYFNHQIETKRIDSKLVNTSLIKHSNSLNNNLSRKTKQLINNNLIKPTSLSLSGNNLLSLNQNDSYSPSSTVKYEAFIMTGEVILNLATSNSKDNCLVFGSKSVSDLKMGHEAKRRFNESNSNSSELMRQCLTNETTSNHIKKNSSFESNKNEEFKNLINNLEAEKTCSKQEGFIDENESNQSLIKKNLEKQIQINQNNPIDLITNKSTSSLNELNSSTKQEQTHLNLLDESNLVETLENNNLLSTDKKNFNEEIQKKNEDKEVDEEGKENQGNKSNLINNDKEVENKNLNNLSNVEEQLNYNQIVDETLSKRYPSFITSEFGEEASFVGYPYMPPRTVDIASAKRLAKRLYNLDKFKKSDVSRHLCKNNDFTKAVTEEYLSYFDFTNQTLLDALRLFLSKFSLIGETQERERILIHFSKRYFDCNPSNFKSSDVVHTLTCAIILLNSDLHAKGISYKMTVKKFIDNLNHLNDGENFSTDFLRFIYTQIKNNKLEWSADDDEDLDKSIQSNLNNSSVDNLTISNIIFDAPNSLNSTEYKKGYLLRKCCCESNGKKTPLGKRGWKLFYATLRDMVLYLHKNDQGFVKSQIYNSLKNSIKIHHSLASIATDYDKRQNVFRLRTSDGAVYLFCLGNNQELDSWVDTINFVAGSFSAPPMPAPVGSQTLKKFINKSVFSANLTNLNFNEQLANHVMRKIKLKQEIHTLNNEIKNNNLSKKMLKEYNAQLNSLLSECERYSTYIMVMNKAKPSNYINKMFDKTSTFNCSKTKSLTTTVIGEEQMENEDEEKCTNKLTNFTDKFNKISDVIKKKN